MYIHIYMYSSHPFPLGETINLLFTLFAFVGLPYCLNKILLFLAVWGLIKMKSYCTHSSVSFFLSLLNTVSLRIPLDMVHSLSFPLQISSLYTAVKFSILLLTGTWVVSVTDNAAAINTLLCGLGFRFGLDVLVPQARFLDFWECSCSVLLVSALVGVWFPVPLFYIPSNAWWFYWLVDFCSMTECKVVSH